MSPDLTTLYDTFGINWNVKLGLGLNAQHQCLAALTLIWLNGSKPPIQPTFQKAFPEERRQSGVYINLEV